MLAQPFVKLFFCRLASQVLAQTLVQKFMLGASGIAQVV
jgi:hypothetical protein